MRSRGCPVLLPPLLDGVGRFFSSLVTGVWMWLVMLWSECRSSRRGSSRSRRSARVSHRPIEIVWLFARFYTPVWDGR
jgi:hypothetical protein